ncbi:alpha/beta fold hydrolase [Xenorhabdus sp. Sc-CR9]|uniref:alpha/beta fold hydrolase n=1 Tax=Xenorhabdus sp. Sc-CR9 TaxID=2584468 RepID=UPI001F1FD42F|nr:alpha/beta hydrolase [Xenorhabdus sp. Sc-CR9]
MNKIAVGGAQVAYRVDGKGPGLVLVHGTGGNSEANWGHLIPALINDWTVVRPDYSGSGMTCDEGKPIEVKEMAAQIVAAAEAAGVIPFDLVGFSLGSAISIVIAADYPHLVRRVILLGPFLSSKDPRQKVQFELWRDLIRTDRLALSQLILLTGFSPTFISIQGNEGVSAIIDGFMSEINWEGMARQVELDLSIDVSEAARRIEKPTLVIGCSHDHIVPSSQVKSVAAAIRGAQYTELYTGHLAHVEKPEEFILLLRSFLLSSDD